jgi:exonuclease SbcD
MERIWKRGFLNMRILHTADWHLGKTLEGRSRLEEQAQFIDELVKIVEDEGVDLILMAGDVYDTVNPPAAAEKLFYEALTRLSGQGKRSVIAIAGNHDHPDRLAASSPLAESQGIYLLGYPQDAVLGLPIHRTGETVKVYPLPYPSESRLNEVLSSELDEGLLQSAYSERISQLIANQSKRFGQDSVNIVMSHLYVLGGAESDSERPIQVGGAYTVNTSAFDCGAHYTALGHLHRPQTMKGPSLIRYSGSPLAYSFSEAGQAKSVTIFDVSPADTKPEIREIVLSSGRPLVKWSAKGGFVEVLQWIEAGKDARSWIDLELHMTDQITMEDIQQLRKAHEGIVTIRPVYPEMDQEASISSREDLPIDELFRRFYIRQTGGAEPDPELIKLFMELLHSSDSAEEEDAG